MKLFKKKEKQNIAEEKRYFAFMIDDIYVHHYNQAFILGSIEGQFKKEDEMYLIGPYGFNRKIKVIEWLELEDGRYGLIVDLALGRFIDKSYIFTNQDTKCSDARNKVNNFYLNYLLHQMYNKKYEYLDYLLEEIASRAYLIVDSNMNNYYTLDHKQYLPLYTNHTQHQLEKTNTFSFVDYMNISLNNDDIEGIIINPGNKKENIVLSKELIEYIRLIKDKNIKRYAYAKKQYLLKRKELKLEYLYEEK